MPWLNFGSGRHIMPSERPVHMQIIDADVFDMEREWVNADKVDLVDGVQRVSMTEFPFPWADDTFDGFLLSHVVEHIPHEIVIKEPEHYYPYELGFDGIEPITAAPARIAPSLKITKLAAMQDAWMAFWSELYRVAKPGAVAHVLSPFAFSTGAMADPTHTRFITEQTFTHAGMRPPKDSETFEYVSDCHWRQMEPARYRPTELFAHLLDNGVPSAAWITALQTQWNVAYDIYVRMEAVK